MATYSKEIPADLLKRSQVDELVLEFIITGAKTARQVKLQNAPVITMFDTGDSSQTAVDNLLGTASDVTYATSFGSTALGTDAFGFVIAHGSAQKILSVQAQTYQSAGGTPANTMVIFEGEGAVETALPNTLTNKCAVTAAGNIYGRFIATNIDSVTAGAIRLTIRFEAS